jgi:hypothetical protein
MLKNLNLDFKEKCINFVLQLYSDLLGGRYFFLYSWKSGVSSFNVRKTSFEERKITSNVVFWKNYAQKISIDFNDNNFDNPAKNIIFS